MKMINDLSAFTYPWSVTRDDECGWWSIVDAIGETVVWCHEDDIEINLTAHMAEQLCALVNAGMIKP